MNIKQIRLSKNITQKQLADAIGVDHTIISRYEKGEKIPSVRRLEMIARTLGVSVDMLLNEDAIEELPVTIKKRVRRKSQNITIDITEKTNMVKRLIAYSKGRCEFCGHEAPFKTADGQPYLEAHYVQRLTEGGNATIDNLVVLCPNCHSRIHHLNNVHDIKKIQDIAKQHDADKIL